MSPLQDEGHETSLGKGLCLLYEGIVLTAPVCVCASCLEWHSSGKQTMTLTATITHHHCLSCSTWEPCCDHKPQVISACLELGFGSTPILRSESDKNANAVFQQSHKAVVCEAFLA